MKSLGTKLVGEYGRVPIVKNIQQCTPLEPRCDHQGFGTFGYDQMVVYMPQYTLPRTEISLENGPHD